MFQRYLYSLLLIENQYLKMTIFYFHFVFLSIAFFKNVECKGELKILDETSWSNMLEGEWMVEL